MMVMNDHDDGGVGKGTDDDCNEYNATWQSITSISKGCSV